MNRTVTFFDEATGEPKEYRRYSARLGAFNEAYGPETGYRVESSFSDLLGLQPGRMAAINEAIANGFNPVELKLIKSTTVLVCTHRLKDKDANVVCDARAAAPITQYKDLELVETASHQRLMAKLGFGGDIFDDDEDRDIQSVSSKRSLDEGLAEEHPAERATPATPAKPAKPRKKAAKASATPEEPKAPDAPEVPEKAPQADAPATRPTPPKAAKAAPPAMIRQLAQLAERVGEEPPDVSTFVQAKAEIKRLSQRASGATAS